MVASHKVTELEAYLNALLLKTLSAREAFLFEHHVRMLKIGYERANVLPHTVRIEMIYELAPGIPLSGDVHLLTSSKVGRAALGVPAVDGTYRRMRVFELSLQLDNPNTGDPADGERLFERLIRQAQMYGR